MDTEMLHEAVERCLQPLSPEDVLTGRLPGELLAPGLIFKSEDEIRQMINDDAQRLFDEEKSLPRIKVIAFVRGATVIEVHNFTRDIHEAVEMLSCAKAVVEQLKDNSSPQIIQ